MQNVMTLLEIFAFIQEQWSKHMIWHCTYRKLTSVAVHIVVKKLCFMNIIFLQDGTEAYVLHIKTERKGSDYHWIKILNMYIPSLGRYTVVSTT
jgi:hypothetical protein